MFLQHQTIHLRSPSQIQLRPFLTLQKLPPNQKYSFLLQRTRTDQNVKIEKSYGYSIRTQIKTSGRRRNIASTFTVELQVIHSSNVFKTFQTHQPCGTSPFFLTLCHPHDPSRTSTQIIPWSNEPTNSSTPLP